MGFIFRRTINLGFFRINFSKSGIGWGISPIPGFISWTRTVHKKRYWTFRIPGTGIAYRTKIKGRKAN